MQLAGLSENEIAIEKQQLKDDLYLISASETLENFQAAGFKEAYVVNQGLTVNGFLAIK